MVAGTEFRVAAYRGCADPNRQAATFVHEGRGYGVIWRGKGSPPERDYRLFDAILKSFDFPG